MEKKKKSEKRDDLSSTSHRPRPFVRIYRYCYSVGPPPPYSAVYVLHFNVPRTMCMYGDINMRFRLKDQKVILTCLNVQFYGGGKKKKNEKIAASALRPYRIFT